MKLLERKSYLIGWSGRLNIIRFLAFILNKSLGGRFSGLLDGACPGEAALWAPFRLDGGQPLLRFRKHRAHVRSNEFVVEPEEGRNDKARKADHDGSVWSPKTKDGKYWK